MLQTARYDLFVSYADADRAWVEGYLLDALDQAGIRIFSQATFELGRPRLLEFERAVRESRRTLLVISPAYLADNFGQFIDLMAGTYGLETATWPIIPLILQPVALPVRLAMLQSLDATDADLWPVAVARLCAAAQRSVPQAQPISECPYPGMAPFREDDAARFFGREREVRELIERLRLHPFITVIGPSGSGKSSLVYAGLLPALRKSRLFGQGDWLARAIRPGDQPLSALSSALQPRQRQQAHADQGVDLLSALLMDMPASIPSSATKGPADTPSSPNAEDPVAAADALLAATPDARRLLLFVDQFEETFTVARSDATAFQQALLRLAEHPNCYVVLTVRADFYPDLMVSPLWSNVQAHRMEVVPLNDDALRQAIIRPAEDAGVFVETALVERLVADAAGEPGALPLIQETLVLLWEHLERRFLPLRAYTALVLPRGSYTELDDTDRTGLQVALARRADAALAELSPEQRVLARRIFLRLIQFGEGRADTRRQQPVSALRATGDDPMQFEQVLRHLADHRLLTLGGHERGGGRQADIAHEALITGWPMLKKWMHEHREAEQVRRRLEAQAAKWAERAGRRLGGALLDEVELGEAEQWLAGPDAAELGYSTALAELVQASRAAFEQAEREKRDTRQREQAQAQALTAAEHARAQAQRRARRRMWALAVMLAGLVLAPVGWVGYREWVRRSVIASSPLVSIAAGPALLIVPQQDDPNQAIRQPPVYLPAFSIEQYEVTNAQYRQCVQVGSCTAPDYIELYAVPDRANLPVVAITPIQAQDYCHWLGRRLPTTTEWERAARGPAGRRWPWGNQPPGPDVIWSSRLVTDTIAVDSHPAGATIAPEAGIFHLADNVIEWVTHSEGGFARIGGSSRSPWNGIKTFVNVGEKASDQSIGFRCAIS